MQPGPTNAARQAARLTGAGAGVGSGAGARAGTTRTPATAVGASGDVLLAECASTCMCMDMQNRPSVSPTAVLVCRCMVDVAEVNAFTETDLSKCQVKTASAHVWADRGRSAVPRAPGFPEHIGKHRFVHSFTERAWSFAEDSTPDWTARQRTARVQQRNRAPVPPLTLQTDGSSAADGRIRGVRT